MDWIERAFGISPDGGSGLSEAVILVSVALVAAIGFAAARRLVAARRAK